MTERDNDTLEVRLGWILRGGVIASSALLIVGLLLSLAGAGLSPAILRAGLVVLLATPIARVAASTLSYLLSKDWLFVILTSIVLLELAVAVLAAINR